MRTAYAQEPGTTIRAVGGGREGEPCQPGGWELWSPLRPLMEAGRHEDEHLASLREDPAWPSQVAVVRPAQDPADQVRAMSTLGEPRRG